MVFNNFFFCKLFFVYLVLFLFDVRNEFFEHWVYKVIFSFFYVRLDLLMCKNGSCEFKFFEKYYIKGLIKVDDFL